MSEDESYRDSHTGTGKGQQYDSYYSTDPWQSFMWRREQDCIDDLLDTHLAIVMSDSSTLLAAQGA